MQHRGIPFLHLNSQDITAHNPVPVSHRMQPDNSPATGIFFGFIVSCLLWGFIGFIVYTVYRMVFNMH